MPDFTSGSDHAMTPDGIEFDPFEMDWPWPGALSEPTAEARQPAAPDAVAAPSTPQAPRLP